jgi:hypothetical protein
MEIPQRDQYDTSPPIVSDRSMPFCRCPANCGGMPEAQVRVASPYPVVTAGGTPPAEPYRPTRPGELVQDVLNSRTGVLMATVGRTVFLRPQGGGVEWDVDARWLERPTAAPPTTGERDAGR